MSDELISALQQYIEDSYWSPLSELEAKKILKIVTAWNNRASQWIPVSERLPEKVKWVNIYGPEIGVTSAERYDELWLKDEGLAEYDYDQVTHWQELPEPPK